jgi:hypothetical protein
MPKWAKSPPMHLAESMMLLGDGTTPHEAALLVDYLERARCAFRSMPATSSGACRAVIPVRVGPVRTALTLDHRRLFLFAAAISTIFGTTAFDPLTKISISALIIGSKSFGTGVP